MRSEERTRSDNDTEVSHGFLGKKSVELREALDAGFPYPSNRIVWDPGTHGALSPPVTAEGRSVYFNVFLLLEQFIFYTMWTEGGPQQLPAAQVTVIHSWRNELFLLPGFKFLAKESDRIPTLDSPAVRPTMNERVGLSVRGSQG